MSALIHNCWNCGHHVELRYREENGQHMCLISCPNCQRESAVGRWPADAIRKHNREPLAEKLAKLLSKLYPHPADCLNENIED
jgi:hypothetical protein